MDIKKSSKKKTPVLKVSMEDGVLGKANRPTKAEPNGSIHINKDVKDPEKIKEIKKHEEFHLDQIDRGDLDYDDKNVYWKGKTYPRSSMVEGGHDLPWEKEVYNKTKSPMSFKLEGSRGNASPFNNLCNRGLIKPYNKNFKK